MGWTKYNEIANQLKHADNDANAMIDPHPIHAMVGIGLAIALYHQLTSSRTPEMQAFEQSIPAYRLRQKVLRARCPPTRTASPSSTRTIGSKSRPALTR